LRNFPAAWTGHARFTIYDSRFTTGRNRPAKKMRHQPHFL